MKTTISAKALREVNQLSADARRVLLEGLDGMEPNQQPEPKEETKPDYEHNQQLEEPKPDYDRLGEYRKTENELYRVADVLDAQQKILSVLSGLLAEQEEKVIRQRIIVDLLKHERDRLETELDSFGLDL